MADGPRTAVYKRLWTILNADTDWTGIVSLPGNRIDLTLDVWRLKPPQERLPATFPACLIEMVGFGGQPFTQATGFAVEQASFGSESDDWVEEFTQEYRIKLFHLNSDVSAISDLEDKTVNAFRRRGAALSRGLSTLNYVNGWTYRSGLRLERVNKVIRDVTTIIVGVNFAFEGRTLL